MQNIDAAAERYYDRMYDESQGRPAPQTSIAKLHERVKELRADLNSVWSDNFPVLRDQLIDEGCELNALLELLLRGEGADAVIRMDRIATKFCFREAQS